ncbi:MAG TPA: hypothetical protein DIC18_03600 [Clostridiales bacterium]|nr:hypothetical protein [Clostridiales bacterium]
MSAHQVRQLAKHERLILFHLNNSHQPAERGEGTKTNALQGANQPAIAPPEPLEAYRYEARQEDANERTACT